MNLREYRAIFVASGSILMLLACAPTWSSIIDYPGGGEQFSELWLLGSEHIVGDSPVNVTVGETGGPLYLGVKNHMGRSIYYVVHVKLRNQTQQPPNTVQNTPSPLPPLYTFRFFVADGAEWKAPVTFTILNGSLESDSLRVRNVLIKDTPVVVDNVATWNSQNAGFYYQLFFELWVYNEISQHFLYHRRFVGIWLNVTV